MKLFQYAIIHQAKETNGKPNLVSDIKTLLADDIDKAKMLAARAIPEEFVDKLDEIEIAIRPF